MAKDDRDPPGYFKYAVLAAAVGAGAILSALWTLD